MENEFKREIPIDTEMEDIELAELPEAVKTSRIMGKFEEEALRLAVNLPKRMRNKTKNAARKHKLNVTEMNEVARPLSIFGEKSEIWHLHKVSDTIGVLFAGRLERGFSLEVYSMFNNGTRTVELEYLNRVELSLEVIKMAFGFTQAVFSRFFSSKTSLSEFNLMFGESTAIKHYLVVMLHKNRIDCFRMKKLILRDNDEYAENADLIESNKSLYINRGLLRLNANSLELFEKAASIQERESAKFGCKRLDLTKKIKTRFFPEYNEHGLNQLSIKEILLQTKTKCEAINAYRKRMKNEEMPSEIVLGSQEVPKPFCDLRVKEGFPTPHIVNSKIIKYKKTLRIPHIFNKNELTSFPLDLLEFETLITLPTILAKAEVLFVAREAVNPLILPYNYDLELLQAALSTRIAMGGPNLEPLETIGDSILKFLYSYDAYSQDSSKSEGFYSNKRDFGVSNLNLYLKSKEGKLADFILTEPIKVAEWTPPLAECENWLFNNASKKTEADCMEAVMGALFLGTHSIEYPFNFLKQMDVVKGEFEDKLSICWKDLFWSKEDMHGDVSLSKIVEQYGIFPGGTSVEECIGYKFGNENILKAALTLKNREGEANNEVLEFIGDAVLDLYVMVHFGIYGVDRLFDKTMVPYHLSVCKQFLTNNNFLGTVCLHSGLADCYNLPSLCLGEVEMLSLESKNILSKTYGDAFEAVIGAVFIDSTLRETFWVLNKLFGPFVRYAFVNREHVRVSPIAEFTIRFSKHFKTMPIFSHMKQGNAVTVFIHQEDNFFMKATANSTEEAKNAAAIQGNKKLAGLS